MPGQFRSSVWDPLLILSQIVTMLSVYYVCLGLWICMFDILAGVGVSLDHIYDYQDLQFKNMSGRIIVISFVCNALTGAAGLWYVVKRTKQCLDFTTTVHFYHFLFCWMYNGYFPNTIIWWLVNIICVIIMTVLGEFLCMKTEMKAIPLALAPKADL